MTLSSVEPATIPGPSPFATPLLDPRDDRPIRAEMLGLERLEALARGLAGACDLKPPARRNSPLLRRFEANGRFLETAHKRIAAQGDADGAGRGTDAEWLADNFHIVEEVLREVRHDLPPGYDSELPKLKAPPLAGYPRVYSLALALTAHTDSELDEARITRFVQAFQEVAPLTIGELWALPTMLRLVLLENLRRLAEQMLWGWDERARAERFAADALASGATGAPVAGRFAPALPSPVDPTDPFVVRILQLLRDRGASGATALGRLEAELLARGVEANETLRREHHRQAANQVSVGNCVIGLRLLSALDWNTFFERVSRVEAILRDDPSGVYPLQDFPSRDRQRRAVEAIARRSRIDEEAVASRAVELAGASPAGSSAGHVGYHLIADGAKALKDGLGYRPRLRERGKEWTFDHPRMVYFGSIAALLVALVTGAARWALGDSFATWWLAPAALALLLPMSELAVGLVNHLLTLLLPPRVLAKLEFKDGVPADCASIVVMPSMLVRPKSAEALLERLEIHYLANPDPILKFALLTDFADADEEHRPEDEGYLRDALDRVGALNARHAPGEPPRFFLFHRRRQWNPVQGKWMGWERKRGKLSEFNRLARGAKDTSYSTLSGDPDLLRDVRYVITLDADTQMPRDTATRMIGTLAHPLNRPRFDPAAGRVVEGYGVLQPRVSFHLTAATHSRFAAILASSGGIDPYSAAASDPYMDLFGVGSFTGKGVYDLDAFEAATGHTFPENRILSHDLIEGNFARCGLLSDTELFDDFPARYHAFARREHRWARGDWQLLPWLRRSVPSPLGPRPNRLPALERWKLLDNLRRSLVAPAVVLLLALGWTVLPGSPRAWTLAALAVPAIPLIQLLIGTLILSVRGWTVAGFLRWRDSVPATLAQVAMTTAFLADQARHLVDATSRTLARLFVTHENMLEWETAATTERRLGAGLPSFFLSMWPAPALASGLAALVALVRPAALASAAPVLAAWALSPVIAWWVSRPRSRVEVPLTAADRAALRALARKTWHFFETFVGDEDHWLPPDNHQEVPDGRVAHRTSPTNQGLLLLSTLAAHDFGYLGTRDLADRLEKTFDAFDKLERHWGHFYNWYDTRTLKPLAPNYISTVDSGNLLGCLVTLRRGLMELAEGPIAGPAVAEGLADAAALAREAHRSAGAPASKVEPSLGDDLAGLAGAIAEDRGEPGDLLATDDWLRRLDWKTLAVLGKIRAAEAAGASLPEAVELWVRKIAAEVARRRADLEAMAPWLAPLRAFEATNPDGPAGATGEASRPWAVLRAELVAPPSLAALAANAEGLRDGLAGWVASDPAMAPVAEAASASGANDLIGRLRLLADRAEGFASDMDFRPLYKPERNLYAIGCNLAQGRLDTSCYDLLASEACLTSLLAVARGDAPRKHWFMLGRPFLRAAGHTGLISWGGTMFEYLMPRLMMRALPNTIVSEAARTAVARQIEYGSQSGVPWGISESSYNSQYVEGDYQYQSFGVPGLGLKRGLERDMVVAPYATALATMIAPAEAAKNLRALAAEGGVGPFGLYEAIDFTRDRVPKGRRSVVVRQYMAHHQGMSLVALGNALLGEPMPRRFHSEPMVRAVDLLLQERIPRGAPLAQHAEAAAAALEGDAPGAPLMSRRITSPATPAPRTHLLSNDRYHVMLTNAGGGRSTCRDRDVTRWREDPTRDHWGQFVYLRDASLGVVWSAGFQPVCRNPDWYDVTFSADKAAFRRRDGAVETLMEVTVSPEAMLEVRRVTIFNHDSRPREIELTSYAEIVLLGRGADAAHPAFGKLFVETEWVPGSSALLARRRPRSADQAPVWVVHVVASEGGAAPGETQYETDRARFLGRGRSSADPAALDPGASLSGTVGPVLDPIVSLRRKLRIAPGGSAFVAFTTAVADSRAEALALADQYRDPSASARAFEVSWAHTQVEHRQHPLSPEAALLFQRLSSHVIYAGSALRAQPSILAANRQPLSALWRMGISGDYPIVLVRIAETGELDLARQLLDAHAFLRLRGLEFDLVLLNEEPSSYLHELHHAMNELVRGQERLDRPGGVFVKKAAHASDDDKALLLAMARVVLVGDRGPLSPQLDRIERASLMPAPLIPLREPSRVPGEPVPPPADLLFFNGTGGFAPDGREYVTVVRGPNPGDIRRNGKVPPRPSPHMVLPPAPWANVVANPHCGFLVTEAGSGFSWTLNSQANRLTPWSNDPVSDPPGECLYLRDEATALFWSPTPAPVPSVEAAVVRHGQGYTTFEKHSHGLDQELTLFVPPDDPVKILLLTVANPGPSARGLSATYYAEWVLGTTREATSAFVTTEVDAETGALLARNPAREEFGRRVAFADVDRRPRTLTADRAEFLGRNGAVSTPAALRRVELSGRTGAALDPCAAIQTKFVVEPGETATLVFLLGEADDEEQARALALRYREPGRAAEALARVREDWDRRLGAVEVHTPDPATDLLLNRWLLYQVLSCRLWARSAFYQSGGAYGFRDQLQDVMALVAADPAQTRAHLLRASARQFLQGDVQHWWHPPTGRGVRTRISDDFLWLPYAVADYIHKTGDLAILEESVPYIEAPLLRSGQEEDYGLPQTAKERGNLYEHCVKAMDHGLRFGPHGLPLMGTGDWNDGMNRVGREGTGESVWLGWFLASCLDRFAPLVEARGDSSRAREYRDRAGAVREAIDASAWDGDWYRRAYFDDGTPLGSSQNDECRIDSLPQTWAVIAGGGDPARAAQAMNSVDEHLVRRDPGVILLFDPPFDAGPLEPGYIKGYLPGIRENGGQYTHAATWVALARAIQGRGRDALKAFSLINPIRHAETPEGVARYRVEPYVLAGDVYGHPPHAGRGGWTWYTGSASWLYRVGVEAILGLDIRGDRVRMDPRIPADWPEFEVILRQGSTTYRIAVENPDGVECGVRSMTVDGREVEGATFAKTPDGQEHAVKVIMGKT